MALCNLFQGQVYQIPPTVAGAQDGYVLTTTGNGGVEWAVSPVDVPTSVIFNDCEVTLYQPAISPQIMEVSVLISNINYVTTISVLLSGQTSMVCGNTPTAIFKLIIPNISGYTNFFNMATTQAFLGTYTVSEVGASTPILMDTYGYMTMTSPPRYTLLSNNANPNVFTQGDEYVFGNGDPLTTSYMVTLGKIFTGSFSPTPPPPYMIKSAVEPNPATETKDELKPASETKDELKPASETKDELKPASETKEDLLADALTDELPTDLTNSVLIQAINLVKMGRVKK